MRKIFLFGLLFLMCAVNGHTQTSAADGKDHLSEEEKRIVKNLEKIQPEDFQNVEEIGWCGNQDCIKKNNELLIKVYAAYKSKTSEIFLKVEKHSEEGAAGTDYLLIRKNNVLWVVDKRNADRWNLNPEKHRGVSEYSVVDIKLMVYDELRRRQSLLADIPSENRPLCLAIKVDYSKFPNAQDEYFSFN